MDPKNTKPETPPADPIVGGPGAEPEPEALKLVTVKHGGRELQVPEDVAAVWQEREREFEQRISRQGAELGELRKRVTQPPPEPRREEPREPDIDTLWFENPKAAYQKIKQEVRQEIVGDYQRDQALQRFWDGFDRANDDLREDRWLAEAVLNDNFDELGALPTRKAQERLGELVRERILKLTRKTKTVNDDPDRARTMLEPASGDRPPRPAAQDDKPETMSDQIREMRRQKLAVRARGA